MDAKFMSKLPWRVFEGIQMNRNPKIQEIAGHLCMIAAA